MNQPSSHRPPGWTAICVLVVAIASAWAGVAVANPALVPSDGPAPDLFLVYTGDVIGYVEPCG